MQAAQPSTAGHKDNLFGVCAALGEDFGFNPFYLRAALAGLLLWNPVAILGAYAFAGVLVLLTRLLFPNGRRAKARRVSVIAPVPAPGQLEPRDADHEAALAIAA